MGGVNYRNFIEQENSVANMLEKPNMAIITIYGLNFYKKKTGSYLHKNFWIYGIAKFMNKFPIFSLLHQNIGNNKKYSNFLD